MATHKSAEKRARQTITRTARNVSLKSRVRTAVSSARTAIAGGDAAKSTEAVAAATREIRRASTKGVLHPRTASRRVGRLARAAHKAAQQKS